MTKTNASSSSEGGYASSVIQALNYFHPISAGVAEYLNHHAIPCFFKKGAILLKADTICSHVYFVKKGAIRAFVQDGKNDITTWITAENEMVTSISSFDLQVPAIENIQAIEDCDLVSMTYHDVERLYQEYPEFNIVIRKVLQKYYRDAEERAFISRLTSAESKYIHFLKTSSHLANRIPQKYIASYLGLAEETLSRVRKRISSAKEKV
jgi:CRP/FNR family transcriptional regulator, anaerobic regulatory protein